MASKLPEHGKKKRSSLSMQQIKPEELPPIPFIPSMLQTIREHRKGFKDQPGKGGECMGKLGP